MNLTNHFLIAMPSLADPNFARTVTYVCAHDADGAMGLVINRPTEVRFRDLLEHMKVDTGATALADIPVVQGGPVEVQRGFVLHEPQPGRVWNAQLCVEDGLVVATSRDILEALARGEGPPRALIALGYAGWGAGQLEAEVLDNAWLSAVAHPEVVFAAPFEARWERAARLMGVDIERLSGVAGHS